MRFINYVKSMKEKNVTIDDLARMVKSGFDSVDKRFDGVDGKFIGIEKRLDNLERGQEDIKLRLDNVAYRFELLELQRRVELLEKKAKFA